MIISKTKEFEKWLSKLKDKRAKFEIEVRISRIEIENNLGYYRSLKGGLFELKIDIGQGYRVYFTFEGDKIIILLCGGDKSSQQKDIDKARRLKNLLINLE